MRTLIISYLTPLVTPGGAQQVAYEEFTALREAGQDPFMIAAMEPHHEQALTKPGAPIVPIQGERNQYFYFPHFYNFELMSVSDHRSNAFLQELIERIAPDVIHFHHYHRVGLEAIRAARNAAPKATIVLTFHEMLAICMADGQMLKRGTRELCTAATPLACAKCFPEHRPEFFKLRENRMKAAFADCDLFTFPTVFLAERFIDWGLPEEKCVVVSNGQVNHAGGFDRTQRSQHLNRFGFFGQMIDNKGVDVVFEALLILAHEKRVGPNGIVLEINGGNRNYATEKYLTRLKDLNTALKAIPNNRITINDRGAYTHAEFGERFSQCDWVVVPSTWWEVFGLVVSEAWMFGRPVIASNIAGLGERITHGEDGLLFRPRDARALAATIERACGNESLWSRLNSGITPPSTHLAMLEDFLSLVAEHREKSRIAS